MARACYSEADIYLLDDPLSALDAHVGKHIFDKVIGPNGMLRDKTRVLVTHRISVLSQCDQIIVMKDGSISECGSYKQLLERKGDFAEFILSHIAEGNDEDIDEEDLKLIDEIVKPDLERQRSTTKSSNSSTNGRRRTLSNGSTFSTYKDLIKKEELEQQKLANDKIGSKLTEAEKSETGSVKWTVYWEYIKKIGLIGASAVLILNMSSSALNIGSSQWLSAWSDDSNNLNKTEDIQLRNLRLGVFGALGCGQSLFLLISTIIVNLSALKGAEILHNDMIRRIFQAPVSFFDTTPMGRILNRFTKDIDVCDTVLNVYILWTLMQIFRAVSALIVMAIGIPYILIAILLICVIYFYIQKLFIPTSRQLKRIESTTRSPIYSHFSETLSGTTSIRAYGTVDNFIHELNSRVDLNNSCSYAAIITSRWLAIRLELLGYSIIFINAMLAVLFRGTLSSGTTGLTLSYAMTITRTLNNLVMATTNLETNIVSVERCLEYTRTPMEVSFKFIHIIS
jgi:ATP-binding cassette subfamily C (CFTR/MRP) protein 1